MNDMKMEPLKSKKRPGAFCENSGRPIILLRLPESLPELAIGTRETENTIGNGFGDGYVFS